MLLVEGDVAVWQIGDHTVRNFIAHWHWVLAVAAAIAMVFVYKLMLFVLLFIAYLPLYPVDITHRMILP
jgi:hypothetical protein